MGHASANVFDVQPSHTILRYGGNPAHIAQIQHCTVLQDMGITVQEFCPSVLVHVHLRGVWLRPACVTLQDALLLEPEQPINVFSLSFNCGSYRIV